MPKGQKQCFKAIPPIFWYIVKGNLNQYDIPKLPYR